MAPKLLLLFEKENDRYWLSDHTGLPIADGCPLLDLKDKELVYETELLMTVTSAMEAKLVPSNYNYLASYKIAASYYVLLEERLDGASLALSSLSSSATFRDEISTVSENGTPRYSRPSTHSLLEGEDSDCTDSDFVTPSQSSTATNSASSPTDDEESDDSMRDEATSSDSDGPPPAKRPVPSTGISTTTLRYEDSEIANGPNSDTDSEAINSGRRRRKPIFTEAPPREPSFRRATRRATDSSSKPARADYTWGRSGVSGSPPFAIDEVGLGSLPRPNPIRVRPGMEISRSPDPLSQSHYYTSATTRMPLPYPQLDNDLHPYAMSSYPTSWFPVPAHGSPGLQPFNPSDPTKPRNFAIGDMRPL
ncbi:hypothetical protein AbraIFM66950_002997 [Aspergillus brasiliensis]|nr:hypothetical protein AbraIFM66950_002997 [Aspergillus brasiliensis]